MGVYFNIFSKKKRCNNGALVEKIVKAVIIKLLIAVIFFGTYLRALDVKHRCLFTDMMKILTKSN